jgi:hypothetical protein
MENCNQYWAHADALPVETIVDYWCEKSGFRAAHCKAAKIAAIVTACERGVLEYGRTDGKDFKDAPTDLQGRGILTIERSSFDAWVTTNFENESPLPEKPLGTTERNTLLTIIAALCKEAKIDYTKPAKAAGLIQSTAALMQVSIGETTIEGHLKKIPDALATRMK